VCLGMETRATAFDSTERVNYNKLEVRRPLFSESMAKPKRSLDRSFIASLSHGLAILEAAADSMKDISLGELSKRVGFKKTSTWRLAHTLVELGYLEQDPHTRNFRPAARVLALGYAYFDALDLKQLSLPFLRELSARHNETVNLAVLNGDELIYVERITTSQIVSINLHVGSRLPLYCTSLGRILISEMSDRWIQDYLRRISSDPNARKYIQGGGKRLREVLDGVRQFGYAVNDEEMVKGLRAVACPVRDRTSQIVAAVCISVPSSRASLSELRRVFAPDLMITARKISLALGYLPKEAERNGSFLARRNEFGRRTSALMSDPQAPSESSS
jgi:IclR family transcriptional regulator, pca regulon regulatory protein